MLSLCPLKQPLTSSHVTNAFALLLLKTSRFQLPKIHVHVIGESKNTEKLVLGDISFAQEFTLLGVGIYEEEAIIKATYRTAMAEQRRGFAYWCWISSSVVCHLSTTEGFAPG